MPTLASGERPKYQERYYMSGSEHRAAGRARKKGW